MATVFMKWLETSPKDYDRGIQLLTLGRLRALKERLADEYIRPGMRVLEIGCGTGTLTQMMAARGAQITAIDAAPAMLAEAERKLQSEIAAGQVHLKLMDATLIGERFQGQAFDAIVSTLVFSELPPEEQRYVLEACRGLLAPDGRLLIADEVVPQGFLPRLLYWTVRLPLVLLTWLLTRTTTRGLRNFEALLRETNYRAATPLSLLGGSLVLYQAQAAGEAAVEAPTGFRGRLRHRVTLKTLLTDLWCLFFRIIPPYPKVKTGLYAIGNPDRKSPVLVTGNFDLTVRRVVRALDGVVDVWRIRPASTCGARPAAAISPPRRSSRPSRPRGWRRSLTTTRSSCRNCAPTAWTAGACGRRPAGACTGVRCGRRTSPPICKPTAKRRTPCAG